MRVCVTVPGGTRRNGEGAPAFLGLAALLVLVSRVASANLPPVIDSFGASPAVPTPAQVVTLTLDAHDPDCAAGCTTGCGLYVRPDLLSWSDNTGRTPSTVFLNPVYGPPGSPWSGTIEWVAPLAEGSYVISAYVADSGGFACGGRAATNATMTITVSTVAPPVIDSFTVSPATVPVGGVAQLSVTAHDPQGGALTYAFSADAGTIQQASPSTPTAQWTAPQVAGVVNLRCQVSGSSGPSITAQTSAQVVLGSFQGWLPLSGGRATRVAGLPNGRIVVLDAVAGTASILSIEGSPPWSVAGLARPVAAAGTGSEIYFLERGANRIAVVGTGGATLRTYPCPGQSPASLAVGPGTGELIVSDTSGAALYVISSSTGQLLRTLGRGTLSFPAGLVCHQGKIAVADPGLRRVLLFDGSGNVLATLGDDTLFVRPQGVTWDPVADRLVVSDSFSAELTVMGPDGSVRGQLAGFGVGPGQITAPVDVQLAGGDLLAVPLATSGQVALFRLLFSLPPVAPPVGEFAHDVAGDSGGAIELAWTKSADDPGRVVSYRIERATGLSSDFMIRGSAAAGATSFVDRGTVDGQCYRYRVAATDGVTDGFSEITPCSVSTKNLPPRPPPFSSAQAQGPETALVTWGPVAETGLAGYGIQVVGGGATLNSSAPAGATRLPLAKLMPDTYYGVSVIAVDSAGNVSAPAQTSFTTYPDEAPPAPDGVVVADTKGGGELSVTWNEAPGRVPVSGYHVSLTPLAPGWPAVGIDATQPPVKVQGLFNRLGYVVTITAKTSWGRGSVPSVGVRATPTAPVRDLAVVPETGWPGDKPDPDAGGISLRIPAQKEDRELRFQYRASRAQVSVLLDGTPLGRPLPDTFGTWVEERLPLPAKLLSGVSAHFLELRNTAFPDPAGLASLRRIDLVPLAVDDLGTESFNTVVDLTWKWAEPRADLTVRMSQPAGGSDAGSWQGISCVAPLLGRCRATFQLNGQKTWYQVRVVSPAGWESGAASVAGLASYEDLPPPVTDLLVTPAEGPAGGWNLNWTPLSTAIGARAAPSRVSAYRIYRQEAKALVLLREVSAPPVQLPTDLLDAAGRNAVVRSVDSLGRESQ